MKYVELHPDAPDLAKMSPERLSALKGYITQEVEDGLSARFMQDYNWSECLRQYEGVPKNPVRNIPIENAPNLEVTLAAIAADAIYAQAIDLIFNQVGPRTIIAQATRDDKNLVEDVKLLQSWIDVRARNEWGVREACEQSGLDWVQLGTGIFIVPWIEVVKKTRVYTIVDVGPRILSHPIEDFLVPGGAMDDLQRMQWIGLRFWLTESELNERASRLGWNVVGAKPCGVRGWMRSKRESLGRTYSNKNTNILYEVIDLFMYFDIDGDGVDEDLHVTWDRTSTDILKIQFNPYDMRDVEAARYQKRAHLFFAMGVLEMLKGYQDELTELHNDTATNSRLANTRMWRGRPSAVSGGIVKVFPNKFIPSTDPGDFGEVKLSDVYPSAYRNEASIIAYAERRVGVRELSGPSPSKVLGGRTPGITALSVMQQTNQRFAPAFDDLRRALAAAVRQCLWRYRERLLAGDTRAAQNIADVLGPSDATRVVELLCSERFEESVSVELTAATASINRAQDRQDALLLVNVLAQYYQRALELMTVAANPQTPPAAQKVAVQIAEKVGEIIDRTIRTFDDVRDPSTFILDMTDAIDSLQVDQTGLGQLAAAVQQGMQQSGGVAGATPPLALPGPGTVQ